jgi:hypothetical protein
MLALCVLQSKPSHSSAKMISNSFLLSAAPISNCEWVRYVAYVFPFTVPITLLLFLCRLHVFLKGRPLILVFVFLSWLCVVGSAFAVAIRTEGTEIMINGTRFCIKRMIERDVSDAVSTLTRFFHDTLVFVVTSWWLYTFHSNVDNDFTNILFGRNMVPIARSLLFDGQAYYLFVFFASIPGFSFSSSDHSATLVLNVIVIVLPLLPKPFVSPCTLGGPLFVLISNLACHVYRNLVSAKYRDNCGFARWEGGAFRQNDIEGGTEMDPWRVANGAGGGSSSQ